MNIQKKLAREKEEVSEGDGSQVWILSSLELILGMSKQSEKGRIPFKTEFWDQE